MKMIAKGLFAFALLAPASAHAGEAYVSVSAGLAFAEDSQNSGEITSTIPATEDFDAIPAGTPLEWRTEFDDGVNIASQVGYALDNGLRLELDVFYSQVDVDTHSGLAVGGAVIDSVDVAVLTRTAPSTNNPSVGAVIADGRGSIDTYGGFANVLYDLNKGGGVEPYIGVGLGYQWSNINYSPSDVPIVDADDGGFAWQAIAGVSVALSQNVDLFGQYQYRSAFDDAGVLVSLVPAGLEIENNQSVATAGLRLRFGGE